MTRVSRAAAAGSTCRPRAPLQGGPFCACTSFTKCDTFDTYNTVDTDATNAKRAKQWKASWYRGGRLKPWRA